jgi:hypothetical protein
MTINRKLVRKEIAGYLQAALEGDGKPAQVVCDHAMVDLGGKAPVILVMSGSIDRSLGSGMGMGRTRKTPVGIYVGVFLPEPSKECDWTWEQVDDAFDDLEAAIADVVTAHLRGDTYERLHYQGQPSEPAQSTIPGYLVETIWLAADSIG